MNTTAGQATQPHPPIVLLVEDDESSRDMYSLALESAGYWVLGARNGDEGLQTAKEYKPDVIVTDLGLPGMDGWAFARALRAVPAIAGAGIIAVSGRARDEIAAQNVEHGDFDVILTKPCLPEDLLREIRKVLARGQMARIKGANQLARAQTPHETSDRLTEKSSRLQRKSRG